MKKHFLFIVIAFAASFVQAQSYQLLNHHCVGDYHFSVSGLTEMRDKNVVANMQLMNRYPYGLYPLHSYYGRCLLKVSHDEAQVLDSVVFLDNYVNCYNQLLEPNPNGEDYIFARTKSGLSWDSLCISRLNEDFVPIAADVTVPLEEKADEMSYYCLGNNDIVMAYILPDFNGTVFSRYGLDGTLKNKKTYSDQICPLNSWGGRMKVWNEERTEYMVCGGTGQYLNHFSYFLLDSTLSVIDSATISPNPTGIYFVCSYDNDMENMDEETFLVATHFTGIQEGILVSKRDKATQVDLKKLNFKRVGQDSQQIIGLSKSSNGDYYLVYMETDLKVVRFDSDLNIVWSRVYYIIDAPYSHNYLLKTLSDGGLAVSGILDSNNYGSVNELFIIIINDDGSANTHETAAFLRPYLFYPNPAQDQLNLQYSPDVQTIVIELYDLQGRLVRTQSQGLESLNMEGLPSGTYTMRVIMKDGTAFSDKVVKE